jgi:DNA-binding CsgD family transcriptional regulator
VVGNDEWNTLAFAFDLSPRELDVLRNVACGGTEKETAALLGLSRHTVRHYARRLYAKLRVASRDELSMHIETSKDK